MVCLFFLSKTTERMFSREVFARTAQGRETLKNPNAANVDQLLRTPLVARLF